MVEETNKTNGKEETNKTNGKEEKEESPPLFLTGENEETIKNKKIIGSEEIGIYLENAKNKTIKYNTANSNSEEGISLDYSSYNTLTDNTANFNGQNGISLFYSSNNNTLTNNTANSNSMYGISLFSSSNNSLTNNTANLNNWGGLSLTFSSNNTIINNISCFNTGAGLSINEKSNNNYLINPISIGNGESDIKIHASLINTTIIDPIIGSWNLELQENTKIIITPDYYNNFENASNRITKSYNKTQEYISSEIARREEEIANLNSKGIKSTKKQKEYFEILKRPIETQKKQIEAQRKYAETQYNTIKGKINIDNLNYTQILPNKEKIKYSIYNDEEGIGESLITYINTIRDDTTKVDVKEKNNIGNDTTNVDNRGIFEKVDELTKELYKLYPDPESSTQEELTIYIPKSFEGRHITLVENARSM